MEVYKFNSDSDSYDLVATIESDGTVLGDSPFAQRVEKIFSEIEEAGTGREEIVDVALEIIERRYNTGYYTTKR